MAKLRAIFIVLVLLACVSISECRTDDIKCQVSEELVAEVEKKQAGIEPKKIIEITEKKTEICGLRPVKSLVEQKSEGRCNPEYGETIERTCQVVTDIHSLVTSYPVPKQGKVITLIAKGKGMLRNAGKWLQQKYTEFTPRFH